MSNRRTTVEQWLTQQDGLDNLRRSSAPMPSPGKDEVLVAIHSVSLNYRDTEVAMGLYKYYDQPGDDPSKPLVPASDMCGVVIAVGEGPHTIPWKVGDRVLSTFVQAHLTGQITPAHLATGLGKPLPGVLQTHRVFPTYGLVRAPGHLSDHEASCLPIAAVTAWMAVRGAHPTLKGKTVLLQGTGGVSISGLQIAKASGARVILTSSSDEKLARAKGMGPFAPDFVINYRTTPQWQDEVMRLTDGRGVDVVVETGGAQTLYKALDCIAFGGVVACIGYTSGREDEGSRPNINLLVLRRTVTLKGILNGPRDQFEEMCAFYEEHGIKPVVDRVFGFGEADEAFKYLFSGQHFGKVVIKVAE
ncbi:putative zinc-binding dehydrogenase [Echria macrotheca]|uniref:Zinc-binding dehydrogenase n=1 Tax=Echria macrotheca TaxID=438768 RepID=A0AAJ0B1S0_9PEZI|nr:putative zinc-binding dehydrogenase [Echria macrotheca]